MASSNTSMSSRLPLFVVMILFSTLLSTQAPAGMLYLYEDENGVACITTQPPPPKVKIIKEFYFQEPFQRSRTTTGPSQPFANHGVIYPTEQNSSIIPPIHSPSVSVLSSDTERNTKYRYKSMSGTKYQYDLSDPLDRIEYETDINAQIWDRTNPNVNIDRSMGQYGGGAKD